MQHTIALPSAMGLGTLSALRCAAKQLPSRRLFFRVVEADFRFQIYFTPQSAAGCLPSTSLYEKVKQQSIEPVNLSFSPQDRAAGNAKTDSLSAHSKPSPTAWSM
jgi:hypothetical protein